MKVAFFLDNSEIHSIDCSQVVESNPGIGGTEHLIICTATLLTMRENGIDVRVFCTAESQLPSALQYYVVNDIYEAMLLAAESGYVTFITKHLASNVVNDVFARTPKGLEIIVWCHIFMSYWEMDYYASKEYIQKIIFVGRETADLYRDHRGFNKCAYIYNSVNLDGFKEKVAEHPFSKRNHVVTYIGSLVPFKGFHLLAEAWPLVLSSVPDAELYIIGSGKLYNSKAELGKYNLAEKKYEEEFIKPLLDANGKILPSVHFKGKMGHEKFDILMKTKVGVPNPSGISETFCLSAVEMQASGARVTTINYPGFVDTVKNGKLYSNKKSLANNIISLLLTNESDYDNSLAYFEKYFSYDSVMHKWEALLSGKEENDLLRTLPNPFYRLKWIKELRRVICMHYHLFYRLPITERFLLYFERLIHGHFTYLDS